MYSNSKPWSYTSRSQCIKTQKLVGKYQLDVYPELKLQLVTLELGFSTSIFPLPLHGGFEIGHTTEKPSLNDIEREKGMYKICVTHVSCPSLEFVTLEQTTEFVTLSSCA